MLSRPCRWSRLFILKQEHIVHPAPPSPSPYVGRRGPDQCTKGILLVRHSSTITIQDLQIPKHETKPLDIYIRTKTPIPIPAPTSTTPTPPTLPPPLVPTLFPTLTAPVPVTFAPCPFTQLSLPHSNPPGGQHPPPTSAPQVCHPCAQPAPSPVPPSLTAPLGAITVTPFPFATVVDAVAGQSVMPQSRPTRQHPPW